MILYHFGFLFYFIILEGPSSTSIGASVADRAKKVECERCLAAWSENRRARRNAYINYDITIW
jgi:hypothetical protein